MDFSLVIPAYNEAGRLPPFLKTVREYCCTHFVCHEVIIVDDGSSDDLASAIAGILSGWPQCRLLRHPQNMGKGAAVRTGVLSSIGSVVLFADADGATPISCEAELRRALQQDAKLAVGSRYLPGPLQVERTWIRGIAGRLFGRLIAKEFKLSLADTQCGFKMFEGDIARGLFAAITEPGYLFDVAVLALARQWGYRIAEVPVAWREIPGSRLQPIRDSLRMWRAIGPIKAELARLGNQPPIFG